MLFKYFRSDCTVTIHISTFIHTLRSQKQFFLMVHAETVPAQMDSEIRPRSAS